MEFEHGTSARTIARLLDPSFLQLSYKTRRKIYKEVGIISSQPIIELTWWTDDENNGNPVPTKIPKSVFYASKALSADALSAFWSENAFHLFNNESVLRFLRRGNLIMWSSLSDLGVALRMTPPGRGSENANLLAAWRQVCINLGAHLPPSHLTLHFTIYLDGHAQEQQALAKDAFDSMLALPVLKRITLQIYPAAVRSRGGLGLHRMGTCMLRRLTCPLMTEQRSRFRFMDLPTELQSMILERTDLVAPGPVTPSMLKGYALAACKAGNCPQGYQCCEKASYDSLQSCWSLPADLFLVNRHISAVSGKIFFSRNKFVVIVRLERSGPLPLAVPLIWSPTHSVRDHPSPGIPGHWRPEHSEFLAAFPPEYIPMLRSLKWRLFTRDYQVALSCKQEADWVNTIGFVAENVRPLSRLTITLDMSAHPDFTWSDARGIIEPRTVACDEVVHPVRALRGIRDFFVHLSWDRNLREYAAEELRLERLAMGEGHHPTEEELKAREAERSRSRKISWFR
jgi:hypothetical protein